MLMLLIVIALVACGVAGWALGRKTASRIWDR